MFDIISYRLAQGVDPEPIWQQLQDREVGLSFDALRRVTFRVDSRSRYCVFAQIILESCSDHVSRESWYE